MPILTDFAAMRASANRKLTMRFPYEPCALPLSPQRVPQNDNFYIWRCLSLLVAGNRTHFKFGVWVEHSKSEPTGDKLSLKCVWPRHVTHFKLLVPLRYLWNGLS